MAGSVVVIGSFDGVHVGHASLALRAREVAAGLGDGTRVVVLAFDPHPLSALRPEACPARLSTFAQRREWFEGLGADEVVRLRPTAELLGMSPEAFCAWLIDEHGIRGIVEGPDFRFGARRAGDVETLRRLGGAMGFGVEIVEPVEVDLSDQTVALASSSSARWLIAHGRMLDARRVLGRTYQLVGEVVRGDRRGRGLGYPTANLWTELLLPADGVYAGRAILDDDREYDAALSVGTNPHFHEDGTIERRAEAYLLDVDREGGAIAGLSEYGWTLRLDVHAWMREQMTFDGVEALVGQIERDVGRVSGLIGDAERASRVLEEARLARSGGSVG